MNSRYDGDVLAGGSHHGRGPRATPVAAEAGLVVEEVATGWCGAVVRVETAGGMRVVHLEDRRGRLRAFPLGPGFLMDGAPVTLTPPTGGPTGPGAPDRRTPSARTASGSRAVVGAAARVAVPSRILVEGRHDAELVEKIWGADLRLEGVVVEMLDGVDDLSGAIRDFAPQQDRRLGVLVDHLVPGTKEAQLVEEARRLQPYARHVKILGHPYVDVWQAVRPARLGLAAWPQIPRGTSWKHGILAHLGWPHETQADVASGWRRILGSVSAYTDLEPTLLAAVEELIDFVTVGDAQ